jgi:hypothetical protein
VFYGQSTTNEIHECTFIHKVLLRNRQFEHLVEMNAVLYVVLSIYNIHMSVVHIKREEKQTSGALHVINMKMRFFVHEVIMNAQYKE